MVRMYGDLISGLVAAVATLLYVYELLTLLEEHEYSVMKTQGPILICVLQMGAGCCAYLSVRYQSVVASYAASILFNSFFIRSFDYQWPKELSNRVVTKFAWQLVIASANMPLSFFSKMAMGLYLSISVLMTVYISPIYAFTENLPIILVLIGK